MKTLALISLLLVISISVKCEPNMDVNCSQQIAWIFQNITDLNITPILFSKQMGNSGHFLNNLGLYDECREDPNSAYSLLNIEIQKVTTFFMGICAVKECRADDLQKYSPGLDKVFAGVLSKILSANLTGRVFTSFSDPEETSKSDMTAGSIISILILVTLFAFGAVGQILSLWDSFNKFQPFKLTKTSPLANASTNIDVNPLLSSEADSQGSHVKPDKKRPSKLEKFFRCFSWSDNIEKIFSTREGMDKNLDVFNGIRFFSMCYVVVGHEYFVRINYISNVGDLQPLMMETGWVDVIEAALYAVDVFFFMGGFFVSFVMIGKLSNPKFRFNTKFVLGGYFHRVYRIWPSYVLAILIYWKVVVLFGNGPMWSDYKKTVSNCDSKWWRNFLFIDNLFTDDTSSYCFGWGWYLSNDLQMFLFTPFLLYLYVKNKLLGSILISLFSIGCMMGALGISIVNNFVPSIPGISFPGMENNVDYFPKYYSKPWVRGDVYFFGILAGILYKEMKSGKLSGLKKAVEESHLVRAIFYIVGLFLVNFLIFCVDPLKKGTDTWNRAEQVLYLVFFRIGYIVGLYLIIFPALVTGNDIVSKILGFKFFSPGARLSFTMYLMHLIVISRSNNDTRQIMYLNHENLIYYGITDLFLTFIAALALTLLIEAPMLNIEKEFIMGGGKKPVQKNKPIENAPKKEEC